MKLKCPDPDGQAIGILNQPEVFAMLFPCHKIGECLNKLPKLYIFFYSNRHLIIIKNRIKTPGTARTGLVK